MATTGIKQVDFAAGAPLDANDLTTLMTNTQIVQSTAALNNTTIDGLKTIPSINTGQLTFDSVKSGTLSVDSFPKFTGDPIVSVTPIKNSMIGKDVLITVSVDKSVSPWKAYMTTNSKTSLGTVYADYIAIEMKPIV